MSNVIQVENLSFSYNQKDSILKNLSFNIPSQSFLAIAGPNGAGKSTLLNLLCRLIKPRKGTIRIDSKNVESYRVKKLAQKIAIVRQESAPVFEFTVAETVMMARMPYLSTFGFETNLDKEIVAEALELTDTKRFSSRPLAQLSGGERQRVFIARALAQNTPILLLDEPTSFLDLKHQVAIYDLLKIAQREKEKTIVAVTHDINLAAQYCDNALLLGLDGSYSIGEIDTVLTAERIEEIFGIRTFSSKIGQEKFLMPLGKFAKDANLIDDTTNSKKNKK